MDTASDILAPVASGATLQRPPAIETRKAAILRSAESRDRKVGGSVVIAAVATVTVVVVLAQSPGFSLRRVFAVVAVIIAVTGYWRLTTAVAVIPNPLRELRGQPRAQGGEESSRCRRTDPTKDAIAAVYPRQSVFIRGSRLPLPLLC
jgi:hypothetical protein